MTSPHDLTADLRALPHPAPPPDLTGAVMARIAQLEDTNDAVIPAVTARRPDWSLWFSLAGLVAGLAIALLNFPAPAGIATFGRGGAMAGLADVSSAPMATVFLVAGFAIFIGSLFLPVMERR
jgi:hypothetical protein